MESGVVRRQVTGTPQGGVMSALLANVYLHRLDRAWEIDGRGVLVRYGDDLVVLCRSWEEAEEALALLHDLPGELGVKIQAERTRVVHLTEGGEGFDFLGFHHRWVRSGRHAHIQFLARWSSRRAMQQARGRIRALTGLSRLVESPECIAQDVNGFLRGWAGYFRYGNAARQFARLTVYAAMRVLLWWAKRERLRRRARRHRFVLAGHLGLLRLDRWVVAPRPHRPWRVRANAVRCRTVGEPCAGEPHARFEAEGLETGVGYGTWK